MSYQDQNSHVAYQQAPKPPTNGLTIACLILGILALVIGIWSLVPFIGIVAAAISFLPALFAVIFGHVGLRAYRTVLGDHYLHERDQHHCLSYVCGSSPALSRVHVGVSAGRSGLSSFEQVRIKFRHAADGFAHLLEM